MPRTFQKHSKYFNMKTAIKARKNMNTENRLQHFHDCQSLGGEIFDCVCKTKRLMGNKVLKNKDCGLTFKKNAFNSDCNCSV